MCYPGSLPVSLQDLVVKRRLYVLQELVMVGTETRQAPTVVVGIATGGGRGGSIKRCVCSPTRHPGSFRCRHHHAKHVWGRRTIQTETNNEQKLYTKEI